MAARSLRSYGRHSRKSSYSFVTIRKLLTRCGATMPLTGAEYRRVVVSRGIARAQRELAACDPRRLRDHRDHHDRMKHADDGGDARRMSLLFALDFQKRSAHPDFKKIVKERAVVVRP